MIASESGFDPPRREPDAMPLCRWCRFHKYHRQRATGRSLPARYAYGGATTRPTRCCARHFAIYPTALASPDRTPRMYRRMGHSWADDAVHRYRPSWSGSQHDSTAPGRDDAASSSGDTVVLGQLRRARQCHAPILGDSRLFRQENELSKWTMPMMPKSDRRSYRHGKVFVVERRGTPVTIFADDDMTTAHRRQSAFVDGGIISMLFDDTHRTQPPHRRVVYQLATAVSACNIALSIDIAHASCGVCRQNRLHAARHRTH